MSDYYYFHDEHEKPTSDDGATDMMHRIIVAWGSDDATNPSAGDSWEFIGTSILIPEDDGSYDERFGNVLLSWSKTQGWRNDDEYSGSNYPNNLSNQPSIYIEWNNSKRLFFMKPNKGSPKYRDSSDPDYDNSLTYYKNFANDDPFENNLLQGALKITFGPPI